MSFFLKPNDENLISCFSDITSTECLNNNMGKGSAWDENNNVTAQQVRITTSAGSLGAAQLRDDIYVAFAPMINLGIDVAATNDAIVTQSVSDLISKSQFQSLIFAI